MRPILLALAVLLAIPGAHSFLVESTLEGFQTLAREHPNILIAVAMSAIEFAVSKKVDIFGGRYGKDSKIPLALALAVFVFAMVAVPGLSLPEISLPYRNLPGLTASAIYIVVVLWLFKEKKIRSKEWVSLSLAVLCGVLAFVFAHFNMLLLSGLASVSMMGLLLLFLLFLLKALG